MTTLDQLVGLSPGFNAAVSLQDDLDNDRKVSAYIPTEAGGEVLHDAGENLHVSASRRARLVMGTYGTGKSHLALVLARLYWDGLTEPLAPVLEKMRGRWPGRADALAKERERLSGGFLTVTLEGDRWGSFDDTLLHGLDAALASAGLGDMLPDTAYHAAVRRIQDLCEHHPNEYARFASEAQDYGYQDMAALEESLGCLQRKAYDAFCEIHKTALAGSVFFQHQLMAPGEVYASVSKRLVDERGYTGIVVIWDEFGRYLERVAQDPGGPEGQSIQRFAERCNNSHREQVHLYLICHRSLQEYVHVSTVMRMSGMSEAQSQEWNKISGRFREFLMRTSDKEIFHLIDQVVVQKEACEQWTRREGSWRDIFDEWTDAVVRLRLFPEMSRAEIHDHVTLGAFPLSPMAAFCLPRISQRVAQNERTMFNFLSDSGADTLGAFLHAAVVTPGEMPPCFSADRLWSFFSRDVEKHQEHRRIWQKYRQADGQVEAEDTLGKRIIAAVALLTVIAADRAPATEDVLACSLNIANSERERFRERLKRLCSREGGREQVLAQNMKDGAYRFTGAVSDQLEERIKTVVKERAGLVSPSKYLMGLAKDLDLSLEILATGYSDDFMLQRRLVWHFVDPGDLEDAKPWRQQLENPPFLDGIALAVICEDAGQARAAQDAALDRLKHPQIVIAIPKEPDPRLAPLLRQHEAIKHLGETLPHLYGEGADLREEWEHHYKDVLDTIGSIARPLFDPDKRQFNWFANGSELQGINSRSRLSQAATEIMRRVFPLTPIVSHQKLTSDEGKDNFTGVRRALIDKLLLTNGAQLLAQETSAQSKTVIAALFQRNGILVTGAKGPEIREPDAAQHEAMSGVWKEVVAFVDRAKKASPTPLPLADLVSTLRRPPYGLRPRTIPPVVVAALRPYALRGYLSLTKSGRPINSLSGVLLDDALMSPENYCLVYTSIGDKHKAILQGLAAAFDLEYNAENENGMVDVIHRGVIRWWRELPPFAQQTEDLTAQTVGLRQRVLARLADEQADPRRILLDDFSVMLGTKGEMRLSWGAVADLFQSVRREIEGAVETRLLPKILETYQTVFSRDGKGTDQDPGVAVQEWYDGLPEARQNLSIPGDPAELMKIARVVAGRPADYHAHLPLLAERITGTPVKNWNDNMLIRFQGRLEGAMRSVEVARTETPVVPPPGGQVQDDPLPPDVVSISFMDDSGAFRRNFVPVKELSVSGKNLKGILQNAVQGIGRTLPAGECETILVDVMREMLK